MNTGLRRRDTFQCFTRRSRWRSSINIPRFNTRLAFLVRPDYKNSADYAFFCTPSVRSPTNQRSAGNYIVVVVDGKYDSSYNTATRSSPRSNVCTLSSYIHRSPSWLLFACWVLVVATRVVLYTYSLGQRRMRRAQQNRCFIAMQSPHYVRCHVQMERVYW